MARTLVFAVLLVGLVATFRVPDIDNPLKIIPDAVRDIGNLLLGKNTAIYLEENGRRMVEVVSTSTGDKILTCNMFGNRYVIQKLLENVTSDDVNVISTTDMTTLINKCEDALTSPTSLGISSNMTKNILTRLFIYPGTKWCGPGNVATNYSELGPSEEADRCCRDHDFCSDNIPAGETKHGLTNDDYYTKSNCSCDDKFYKCLQDGNTISSHSIGIVYFNIARVQCFKFDYPIVGCRRHTGIPLLLDACQEYELDVSQEPTWQFFDAKYYYFKSNASFVNNTVYIIPESFLNRLTILSI